MECSFYKNNFLIIMINGFSLNIFSWDKQKKIFQQKNIHYHIGNFYDSNSTNIYNYYDKLLNKYIYLTNNIILLTFSKGYLIAKKLKVNLTNNIKFLIGISPPLFLNRYNLIEYKMLMNKYNSNIYENQEMFLQDFRKKWILNEEEFYNIKHCFVNFNDKKNNLKFELLDFINNFNEYKDISSNYFENEFFIFGEEDLNYKKNKSKIENRKCKFVTFFGNHFIQILNYNKINHFICKILEEKIDK